MVLKLKIFIMMISILFSFGCVRWLMNLKMMILMMMVLWSGLHIGNQI